MLAKGLLVLLLIAKLLLLYIPAAPVLADELLCIAYDNLATATHNAQNVIIVDDTFCHIDRK